VAFHVIHSVNAASLQQNDAGRHLVKASGGRLWCVFADRPAGYSNYQLFCAWSDDGGVTWTEEQITTEDIYQYVVSLAIDSGDNLHIAYYGSGRAPYPTRNGVFYCKRTASGWGDEETVALKDVTNGQEFPAIAIDSHDDIHVVWQGKGWGDYPTYRQIIYRKKTVFGWEPEEVLTGTNLSTSYGERYPAIAVDRWDDVHVVWGGTVAMPGNYSGIKYRRRTPLGWEPQENVTEELDCYHWQPRIALDSNNYVHVAWFGMMADEGWSAYNPKYRRRTAGWWPVEKLCTTTYDQSDFLTIALDANDDVHVGWGGYGWGDHQWSTNLQYRKMTGSTWSDREPLTNEAADFWGGSAIWANFPIIGGERANILPDSINLVTEKLGESVLFYKPDIAEEPGLIKGSNLAGRLITDRAI
jgi:hypothetical protein